MGCMIYQLIFFYWVICISTNASLMFFCMLTLMLLVANLTIQKKSDEHQRDRVKMVFKIICILELWTQLALALEGLKFLKWVSLYIKQYIYHSLAEMLIEEKSFPFAIPSGC